MNPKQYKQMMDYLTRPAKMPDKMKVAQLDNVNTPDLDQTPDSILRPGETLEDFDVTFRRPNADGGRIGFQDGKDVRLDAIGRQNTKVIKKEESLKKIFDEIFEEKNFSGIKSEFPGLSRQEIDAGIKRTDPSRKGKTGGKIPNQWYSQHVKKAIEGDVDALNDLSRITGRSVKDLQDAFSKRNLKAVRSEAAAKSSAKLDPINKKLTDLIKNNVVDKETIKKTLNISEDKFQKSIATIFKQSYDNRGQINKGNKITSYLGNTAEEITNLLQNLKKVDGVNQVTQRRNITQVLDDLFGVEGTLPNAKAYNTMMKRVDEFYKLRALLPEGIKLNLDHPIPEILIQQLEKSGPTTLRANIQPITQALNMGLKNKIDIAYANAYTLASKGDVNAKKIMGAIDEVADKIGLPLGKVTDQYVGFGKNPFLSGDLKKVIVDNLKAQNSIVSKFEALDPKLKKRAGLDRLKNINIPQINIKSVERAFGISNEAGFIARELIPGVTKTSRRILGGATGFVLPEILFYQLDKKNRISKGVSEEEAEAAALQSASLGAFEDKEYMKNLKKVGESMGIDSRSFDAAYDMNVLLKNYNQNSLNFQNQYLNLLETGDEKRADDLKKNFDRYNKEAQNKYSLLANNISDNVMNTVGASPLIMEQGRKNITQEQFAKPFEDLQKVGLEKLKQEKIKASPIQKRQVDTTAGSVGEDFYQTFDSLTQGAKNLLQGRVIPFASKIGLPQYEPQASQREILSDTLQNLSDRDLERLNLGRGYVQSDPVSKLDLQNLAAERPGLFYANGGIAGLSGGIDKGPQRRSMNPDSQGLSGILKRGIKT